MPRRSPARAHQHFFSVYPVHLPVNCVLYGFCTAPTGDLASRLRDVIPWDHTAVGWPQVDVAGHCPFCRRQVADHVEESFVLLLYPLIRMSTAQGAEPSPTNACSGIGWWLRPDLELMD